jgi:hypothetical protein
LRHRPAADEQSLFDIRMDALTTATTSTLSARLSLNASPVDDFTSTA